MKDAKITFNEHKKFGALSKIFNDKLVMQGVKIVNTAKNKKEGRKKARHYTKAIESLSKLRDHLEEIMFKDYPKLSTTSIYYGER